jgi:hypothetical protein
MAMPSNLPFVVVDPVYPCSPRRQIECTWLDPSKDIDVQTSREPASRIDDIMNCQTISKNWASPRCDRIHTKRLALWPSSETALRPDSL